MTFYDGAEGVLEEFKHDVGSCMRRGWVSSLKMFGKEERLTDDRGRMGM